MKNMSELKVLNEYNKTGSFYFTPDQDLKIQSAGVPSNASGIYIIFSVPDKKILYIGASGKMKQNGILATRKGGIKQRIVYGHQFGKIKRFKSIPKQMELDNIPKIKISWWVTHDENIRHIPKYTEALLLQKYYETHGELPFWNKEY